MKNFTAKLKNDYQKITNDNNGVKPLLTEIEFIELFLNKQLTQINESLLTWSEESKKTYKETYKRILSDRNLISKEIELI